MPAYLYTIEVVNFKSFRGKVVFGPFKPFMCIVGPNGSGKSNFMDAISFVMGENKSLRVSRQRDLIHGAVVGQPVSKRASVTAVFLLEDTSSIRFTRSIHNCASEYQINEQPVTKTEYLENLKLLGLNVQAKNFLVFQGEIESLSMKSPKERCTLFEELSGSVEFKEEYERQKSEMEEAENGVKDAVTLKKTAKGEENEMLLHQKVAEKYRSLQRDLSEKESLLKLFQFYYIEKDIKNLEDEAIAENATLQNLEDLIMRDTTLVIPKEREGDSCDKIALLKEEIQAKETEKTYYSMVVNKIKEAITHLRKKKEHAGLSLKRKEADYDSHANYMENLQKELESNEKMRHEFEQELSEESQSQDLIMSFEETQLEKYHKLKNKSVIQSFTYQQDLESLSREHGSKQDELDNISSKILELENLLRHNELKKNELLKRRARISEQTEEVKATLQEMEDQKQELVPKYEDWMKEKGTIELELKNIEETLIEAHSKEFNQKQKEALKALKAQFSLQVFDRIKNICRPIHERYDVAAAKVMGENLHAIVVDTAETAKKCIRFLRMHQFAAETFLPLDSLQLKYLQEHKPGRFQPIKMIFLYHGLEYSPPDVEKAVRFVANDTLVCDTSDDAFESLLNCRLNVVSLDGTYFERSGIISGGSLDLQQKAKKLCDKKQISELQREKEQLIRKKLDLNKYHYQSEITVLESSIPGIKIRCEDLESRNSDIEMQLIDLDLQSEDLKREIKKLNATAKKIKFETKEYENRIQKLDRSIQSVEDYVFKDFCNKSGIKSIREYDGHGLRFAKAHAEKRLELNQKRNCIQNKIDCAKEEASKIKENIRDLEKVELDIENDLASNLLRLKKNEKKLKESEEGLRINIEKLTTIEKNLEQAQTEATKIAESKKASEKRLKMLEMQKEHKMSIYHNLMEQCKLANINIRLDNSRSDGGSSTPQISGANSSESAQEMCENESRRTIDYSKLPKSYQTLKNGSEIRDIEKNLQKIIEGLKCQMESLRPNFKAKEKLQAIEGTLYDVSQMLNESRKAAKKARVAFENTKKKRHDRFMDCFETVSSKINEIYQHLTQSPSGQAILIAENAEEPYLAGISYSCIVPGKPFQPMQNLSGGERTLAAVALLLALHCYQPAPFFVLDEIDAALDNYNIMRVAKYLGEKSASLQSIVISLKAELYCHADALIGICKKVNDAVSNVLAFDLTQFPTHLSE